jgi:hypothetical protein
MNGDVTRYCVLGLQPFQLRNPLPIALDKNVEIERICDVESDTPRTLQEFDFGRVGFRSAGADQDAQDGVLGQNPLRTDGRGSRESARNGHSRR